LELGVRVHGRFDDRQARRAALLASVAKGRLHEIFDREVDVGTRGDDERVLATRFAK
jgi:hypothetical protein